MNGPSFEEVTRQQNCNNPRFAFLFGGEFSDYYKYRLHFAIQNCILSPNLIQYKQNFSTTSWASAPIPSASKSPNSTTCADKSHSTRRTEPRRTDKKATKSDFGI